MGSSNTAALRELLLGLCSDARWKYAAFWKLESESHGILIWGDGYVNKTIGDTHLGDVHDHFGSIKRQIMSFITCTEDDQCGSYEMCPIEATLLNMTCHWYSLGEEIIGRVALMGQHCWIFANQLSPESMFRYSADWQLQFAAGIKTVLLVPIMHHGVLQLGSLDMVSDDSELVAQIKDLFYRHYNISAPNTSMQHTATLSREPLDIASYDWFDLIDSAQFLTSGHHGLPLSIAQSDFPLLEDVTKSTTCLSGRLGEGKRKLWTDTTEDWKRNLFLLDELPDSNVRHSSMSCADEREYDNYNGCSLTDLINEYQQCCDSNAAFNYSLHSELPKETEVVSREEHEVFMWENMLNMTESKSLHSLPQTAQNDADVNLPLENEPHATFLRPMIADTIHPLNDTFEASEHTISSCQLTDSPTSCTTHIQKGDHLLSLSAPNSINECSIGSVMTESFLPGNDMPMSPKCMDGAKQELRGSNSPQNNKKRNRSGEFLRPRPRDRQLIQDRMEELRELVPNGSKCSIDALLDSTIAYMLFLQSVSEQAENLKNSAVSKDKVDEQDSHNQTKKITEICPLRVEELDQPGQILIEMLCEEYGLFLDIAHMIKSLQLTILKGLLEKRSDKLWAHFIIQASKGFNQMQILCPLMHLLQRS